MIEIVFFLIGAAIVYLLLNTIPTWLAGVIIIIFVVWKIYKNRNSILNLYKIIKSDDLMRYPYYSRTEINYYKALSENCPLSDKWAKKMKDAFARQDKLPKEKILQLTNDEYSYLEENFREYAATLDFKRVYRNMITENLAIINGKKTFTQVEENEFEDGISAAKQYEDGKKLLKKELEERHWKYK